MEVPRKMDITYAFLYSTVHFESNINMLFSLWAIYLLSLKPVFLALTRKFSNNYGHPKIWTPGKKWLYRSTRNYIRDINAIGHCGLSPFRLPTLYFAQLHVFLAIIMVIPKNERQGKNWLYQSMRNFIPKINVIHHLSLYPLDMSVW